jgi:hypothetical protein
MATNVPELEGGDAVTGVASAESELSAFNALSLNAMDLKSLDLYDLHLDTLAASALSERSIDAIQASGTNGAYAREFVRYAVGCAFDATQTFAFSWTEGQTVHNEIYPGSLGLATSWATTPLTATQRAAVSACLLARVNYYGTTVVISLRGPQSGFNQSPPSEVETFSALEGAFWGDVFGTSPVTYSCHHGANITVSRAKSRVCAAGHLNGINVEDCGNIKIVGDCAMYCQTLLSGGTYFPACRSSLQGSYNYQPLTAWLEP